MFVLVLNTQITFPSVLVLVLVFVLVLNTNITFPSVLVLVSVLVLNSKISSPTSVR